MKHFEYAVLLKKEPSGGYVVTCRDLPQLITQGESIEDALLQASDAMDEVFAAYVMSNLKLPEPSPKQPGEYMVAPPQDAQPAIAIKEIGSFHLGGRQVALTGLPPKEMAFSTKGLPLSVDPNGEVEVEQMYVQFVKLAQPKSKLPLLLWHGGGLTGVTYETKPDGNPGWQMYFLRAGWDTYVSDAVERGRASWARYPEIFKTEPIFRTKKEAWELFRVGPNYHPDSAQRLAYPQTEFPTEAFDQLAKQAVPRWLTNDAATQKAYDAYVQKMGPCVIVVHSQSGYFGLQAALNNPDKVKALVLVEPHGSPDPSQTDLSAFKHIPTLWVWGDYVNAVPFWSKIYQQQENFRAQLLKHGARADLLNLPALGIQGNSHMPMMDRNSDAVATLIQKWLVEYTSQ
jgi:predicted RNase H-like HicB family nuclease/pimeloyl-ACP methyl ester carboxylesterase